MGGLIIFINFFLFLPSKNNFNPDILISNTSHISSVWQNISSLNHVLKEKLESLVQSSLCRSSFQHKSFLSQHCAESETVEPWGSRKDDSEQKGGLLFKSKLNQHQSSKQIFNMQYTGVQSITISHLIFLFPHWPPISATYSNHAYHLSYYNFYSGCFTLISTWIFFTKKFIFELHAKRFFMHLSQVAISEIQSHCTEFMFFTTLLGFLSQLDNYSWGSVPYIALHKTSTLGYFQGSWECEVFLHHTAMKINSGICSESVAIFPLQICEKVTSEKFREVWNTWHDLVLLAHRDIGKLMNLKFLHVLAWSINPSE